MLEMIGRAWRSGECDRYESVIRSVAARRWHGMQQIKAITRGTYRVCVCVCVVEVTDGENTKTDTQK